MPLLEGSGSTGPTLCDASRPPFQDRSHDDRSGLPWPYLLGGATARDRVCACSLKAPMPKSTAPKRRRSRRSPPKISAVEKTAVRIMRKLHEATGGRPQRWESLDNLGAVKADAAGIAYAVARDWLIAEGNHRAASALPNLVERWSIAASILAALQPAP
jgi:hypothetical protein